MGQRGRVEREGGGGDNGTMGGTGEGTWYAMSTRICAHTGYQSQILDTLGLYEPSDSPDTRAPVLRSRGRYRDRIYRRRFGSEVQVVSADGDGRGRRKQSYVGHVADEGNVFV